MPYWARCRKCNQRFIGLTLERIEQQLIEHFRNSHKVLFEKTEDFQIIEKQAFIRKIRREDYELYKEAFEHSEYWKAVRLQPIL